MKNKGFTLVELLAMLVVLGILMVVAIPNISGILNSQKTNTLRNDVITMTETAKVKVAKDSSIKRKLNNNGCVVFSLNYLNDNGNVTTGPNGGKYEQYDSFVIMKKAQGTAGGKWKYEYYVRLLEKNESDTFSNAFYYGIELDNVENVKESNKSNIKKYKNYTGLIGLSNSNTPLQNSAKILTNQLIKDKVGCNNIIEYYMGDEIEE